MTIEEKWNKLSDDEKNKIIATKILGLKPENDPVLGLIVPWESWNYRTWAGFGKIVEKSAARFTLDSTPDGLHAFRFRDTFKSMIETTPWDAAALAYLKMKGIEICSD